MFPKNALVDKINGVKDLFVGEGYTFEEGYENRSMVEFVAVKGSCKIKCAFPKYDKENVHCRLNVNDPGNNTDISFACLNPKIVGLILKIYAKSIKFSEDVLEEIKMNAKIDIPISTSTIFGDQVVIGNLVFHKTQVTPIIQRSIINSITRITKQPVSTSEYVTQNIIKKTNKMNKNKPPPNVQHRDRIENAPSILPPQGMVVAPPLNTVTSLIVKLPSNVRPPVPENPTHITTGVNHPNPFEPYKVSSNTILVPSPLVEFGKPVSKSKIPTKTRSSTRKRESTRKRKSTKKVKINFSCKCNGNCSTKRWCHCKKMGVKCTPKCKCNVGTCMNCELPGGLYIQKTKK